MSVSAFICRVARSRVGFFQHKNTKSIIFITTEIQKLQNSNSNFELSRNICSSASPFSHKRLFTSCWENQGRLNDMSIKRNYATMPPHEKVLLPNLSPTMTTGTIVSWEKKVGDKINEGDVLALIETDKSTMEMETPEPGYLAKIIVPVGTRDVAINQLIAIIVSNEEDLDAFKNYTGEETTKTLDAKLDASPSTVASHSPPVVEEPPPPSSTNRVFASPLAKRVALEKGIDINNVVGSGPRGRITVADIENFKTPLIAPKIEKVTAAPISKQPSPELQSTPSVFQPSLVQPPVAEGVMFKDIPLSNMRKTIAKRLTESKQTVPHYYLTSEINMDKVFELRSQLNAESLGAFKLSINDFVIKAAALSLRKVPECNSQWFSEYIRQFENVDVSVAVSIDGGLITPIVKDADKKGLTAISADVVALANKARDKTIQPHEFLGGTFTVSNLGMYGISNFSAVINPPQSCILAVSASEDRVVPDQTSETRMKISKMMSVTLSCDHRVVDGAVGAAWLKTFRGYLEKPITMLL
ncbi:dihydrolipoyllysine-residue acetyltransferase component of pyruvate dehydrogenase complex, mitochondrial isoform X1 [Hydra vulgaris]|uniref:Acetyltransferase component of pyruvate dehydrogenase complex n=1 Tax=Hydra vulgaris TaxID=6087 RepID=T2MH45_HYDVU|nr:dihydrolipoyllysine-residue acetyltransferase component of pyruvate dehydrogenase complex, mitochondrial [Hydra vulgaris]